MSGAEEPKCAKAMHVAYSSKNKVTLGYTTASGTTYTCKNCPVFQNYTSKFWWNPTKKWYYYFPSPEEHARPAIRKASPEEIWQQLEFECKERIRPEHRTAPPTTGGLAESLQQQQSTVVRVPSGGEAGPSRKPEDTELEPGPFGETLGQSQLFC